MLDSITVSRPGRKWAKTGQNGWKWLETGRRMPKMAQTGPFDPPKGTLPTFEKFHFCPFLGPSGLVVGWQLMVVGSWWRLVVISWRLTAVGDCPLAVGSCRVGNGGIPSACDARVRDHRARFGWFWALLGPFGPWRWLPLREASRPEMGQNGQKRVNTCPK